MDQSKEALESDIRYAETRLAKLTGKRDKALQYGWQRSAKLLNQISRQRVLLNILKSKSNGS